MLAFSVADQRTKCAACHSPSIAQYGLCVVRHGADDDVTKGSADRVSRPVCLGHFSAAADVALPAAFLPPATAELLARLRHRERIDDPVGAAELRKQLALLRLPEALRRERGQALKTQRQRLREALRSKQLVAASAARASLLALRRGVFSPNRTEEALDDANPSPPPSEALLDAGVTAAEIRHALGERVLPVSVFVRSFKDRVPKEKRPAFKGLVSTLARLGRAKPSADPSTPKVIVLRPNELALLRGKRRWGVLRQKFWAEGDLARRARLQARVDLYLIRNGLAEWIDAKRQRRERAA